MFVGLLLTTKDSEYLSHLGWIHTIMQHKRLKPYSTAHFKPGVDTRDDYNRISWVHMLCCKVVVQWPCIATTSRCSHLILLNGEQVYKAQTKQREASISEARTFMHSCSWLSLAELSIKAPCWFELVTRSKMYHEMLLLCDCALQYSVSAQRLTKVLHLTLEAQKKRLVWETWDLHVNWI